MAFKDVIDLNPDNTIALGGTNRKTGKKNPTSVEGYYLGSRKIEDRKKKSGFSYIHVLQTDKGSLGVWGKTDLDRKVLSVTPGTMILASFDKMVPTPNGDMYKFKVQFDPENTIEVESQQVELTGNDESTEVDGQDEYAADEDEDTSSQAVHFNGSNGANAATQVATAAERQAKVQALLSKNKVK